jgi:hypothetical protein
VFDDTGSQCWPASANIDYRILYSRDWFRGSVDFKQQETAVEKHIIEKVGPWPTKREQLS